METWKRLVVWVLVAVPSTGLVGSVAMGIAELILGSQRGIFAIEPESSNIGSPASGCKRDAPSSSSPEIDAMRTTGLVGAKRPTRHRGRSIGTLVREIAWCKSRRWANLC